MDNEVRAALARHFKVHPIIGGLGVVAAWVPFIAALFGRDVIAGLKTPPQTAYLILALVLDALIALWVWRRLRLVIDLAQRGQQSVAGVIAVSAVSHNELKPVTFMWVVGGRQYTLKKDVLLKRAAEYDEQTRVVVVYDTQNPGRAMVLEQLTTQGAVDRAEAEDEEPFVTSVVASVLDRAMPLLLFAGFLVALAFVVGALAGRPTVKEHSLAIVLAAVGLASFGWLAWDYWRGITVSPFDSSLRYRWVLAIALLLASAAAAFWQHDTSVAEARTQRQRDAERQAWNTKVRELPKVDMEKIERLRQEQAARAATKPTATPRRTR